MKFIDEGLKHGSLALEDVFSLLYGGKFNEKGELSIQNYSIYSEVARQELIHYILKNSPKRGNVLTSFLSNVHTAIYNGRLVSEDQPQIETRLFLAYELLQWKKWGVSPAEFPLNETIFMLIYRGKEGLIYPTVENFNNYPKRLRLESVLDLSITHPEMLQQFVTNSYAAIKAEPFYYNHQWRQDAKWTLFKEFRRWQNLGIDIEVFRSVLFNAVNRFITQKDCNGLTQFFNHSGFLLPQAWAEELSNRIRKETFKKENSQTMFLNCIKKNTQL